MIVELPEWHRFAAGSSPWTPPSSEGGRVVVALAPTVIPKDRWAAFALIDLLDQWAEAGHRVVLVDCVLDHPMLHRPVGVPHGEGLADAALFGASVSRIAQAVPGHSFFFVSAGSPTGDPEAVLGSPRWTRMKDGFREAGVTLVTFIREGGIGTDALVAEADDVVVFLEEPGEVSGAARAAGEKVRALIGPEHAGQGAAESVAAMIPGGEETREDAAPQDDVLDETGTDAGQHPADPDVADVAEVAEGPMAFGAVEADTEESVVVSAEEHLDAPVESGEGVEVATHPAPEAQVAPRRSPPTRGAVRSDPDTRKKLTWVALAVLVLVVIVVLGALR